MEQQGNPPQQPLNERPKTWLVESILATILCCLPFGIVGIINASKVDSLYAQGLYDESAKASANAKKWTIWAAVVGLIVGIIYGILLAVGVVAGLGQ